MLTIHNIFKINSEKIYRPRMSIYKIETLDSAYIFHLLNPNMEAFQITLPRYFSYINGTYELWMWDKNGRAIQYFLRKEDMDTPQKMLLKIQTILNM